MAINLGTDMKISIIIPCFNTGYLLNNLTESILQSNQSVEIIIIDDCSKDESFEIATQLAKKNQGIISVYKTEKNSGPGIARNIGIENATGEYLWFLDSDDLLSPSALLILANHIEKEKKDIVSFNWKSSDHLNMATSNIVRKEGRNDFNSLRKIKMDLIGDYIELKMDGSVIYTLIKKELVIKNNLRFSDGIHEDVDFIFKVYFFAETIGILDDALYLKGNRTGSIINTVSIKHVEGIFRAYESVYNFLKEKNLVDKKIAKSLGNGLVAIIATRVRDSFLLIDNKQFLKDILLAIYENARKIIESHKDIKIVQDYTKYFMVYNLVNSSFDTNGVINKEIDEIKNSLTDILKNSWSCFDIHNSLFLAPDEIRTCCKRFFSEGTMKGDVVLIDDKSINDVTFNDVIAAKQKLYNAINNGTSDECRECPFLEFKKWDSLDNFKIKYLSLEYHSLCNMRCVYCDDKYYGGLKENYNVLGLIDAIKKNESFDVNAQIIWGGGEPTLSKSFNSILTFFHENFPHFQHRIITNATRYLPEIKQLLDIDAATIVTSIDAGTADVFKKVRANKNFELVLKNLREYSATTPQNVIIKYILLDENSSFDEIESFCEKIIINELSNCNFQISCNFKNEILEMSTAIAAIYLFHRLLKVVQAKTIYFDDLLRIRLRDLYVAHREEFDSELSKLKIEEIIEKSEKFDGVAIWGAGLQTQHLLENTFFFSNVKKVFIVDDTIEKIGTFFAGHQIHSPKELLNNQYPVIISAVQSTPKIMQNFSFLKLSEKRLIKGLIL